MTSAVPSATDNIIQRIQGPRVRNVQDTDCYALNQDYYPVSMTQNSTKLLKYQAYACPSFLPSVLVLKKSHPDKVKALSESCYVPNFFWGKTAHKANGFYGCHENPKSKPDWKSRSIFSRFLIKELLPADRDADNAGNAGNVGNAGNAERKYDYRWQYIGITSFWECPDDDLDEASSTILCFLSEELSSDVPKEEKMSQTMKKTILDGLNSVQDKTNVHKCAYAAFDLVVEILVNYFDHVCWGFQPYLRDIEKGRETATLTRDAMKERYIQMHEMSRHVIHIREILEVASRSLKLCSEDYNKLQTKEVQNNLQFHAALLNNLSDRADTFDERLKNEILLAYNLIAAEDNDTSKKLLSDFQTLLKQTRDDGRELTNLVSLLTLLFLPGTFFSGFFGMNFFSLSGDNWVHNRNLWIFFATAGPVTFIALGLWIAFRRKRERKWPFKSKEEDEAGPKAGPQPGPQPQPGPEPGPDTGPDTGPTAYSSEVQTKSGLRSRSSALRPGRLSSEVDALKENAPSRDPFGPSPRRVRSSTWGSPKAQSDDVEKQVGAVQGSPANAP